MRTVDYDPPTTLDALETAILDGIASHYLLPALSEQLKNCRVTKREYSGCGFFTTLVATGGVLPAGPRFYDGGLVASPDLPEGAGSILFVENGRLDVLEVYAYGESYPDEIRSFSVKPVGVGG